MNSTQSLPTAVTTNNVVMVSVLTLVGIRLADDSRPCGNIYSRDTLARYAKQLGVQSLTAKEAARRELPGNVQFGLLVSPEFDPLIKAFDRHKSKLKEGGPVTLPDVAPEDAVVIAYQAILNYLRFADAWRTQTPIVQIGNKLVSINASKETRAHLEV